MCGDLVALKVESNKNTASKDSLSVNVSIVTENGTIYLMTLMSNQTSESVLREVVQYGQGSLFLLKL